MRKAGHGFTLIELLVVIIVIAILATISIMTYRGLVARANDVIVSSDFRFNLQRIQLFYAENNRLPSSNDLAGAAADDYKIKVSKRSVYAFYGYCTGSYDGQVEIIMTAGTANGHQFYVSSLAGDKKDVSSDFNAPSAAWGSYKCIDYLKPGSSPGEFRDMIHRDGGVEGGYVTISSP